MNKHVQPCVARGILSVRAETTTTAPAQAEDKPTNINDAIEQINKAFAEFKAENDKKIADLQKGKGDIVQDEKLERINAQLSTLCAAIDELNTKQALAAISKGGSTPDTPEMAEFKASFENWFRTGSDEEKIKAAYRTGGVMAAMSTGSDTDGGFTAPVEWDRTITDKLKIVTPMRRYASVQNVKGSGFKRLFNLHGATSGWVGETDPRPETSTHTYAQREYKFGEIYANPAISQSLLEDSELDIASHLAAEVEQEFSEKEGLAFLSGNGILKPKGVLMYDKATEDALPENERHPFGPVGEVITGSASDITADGLIDLTNDIPSARVTEKSALFMNRKTHAKIRKMKDGQGNYLWQPPFQAQQPPAILGYPTHEMVGMPDVAANTIPIIFGDMAMGYRIFDRRGISVLRDPYTQKPFVLFYTTKRVGGGLWNSEYLRYHRVSA
ncbi:phage major capsid protein [Bartonella apihabitans]|nr:phage major capsid protein [Bartonella apihabitans]WLT07819.1 phage major capsid protein [Bartonella apihabitans]